MPTSRLRWLDVVRPRVRRMRAPFFLVVQHHDIAAVTLLAAPITPLKPGSFVVLAPKMMIGPDEYRARLLDMAPVAVSQLGEVIGSAVDDADAIMSALDVIFHGYPIGRQA